MKLLHIYGQESFHDNVYIIGNKEALATLRDALNVILDRNLLEWKIDAFINDGEGYSVFITKDDNEENWTKRAVPYTADYAKENREEAIWPWERLENSFKRRTGSL